MAFTLSFGIRFAQLAVSCHVAILLTTTINFQSTEMICVKIYICFSFLLYPLSSQVIKSVDVNDWYEECFKIFLNACCKEGSTKICYSNYDLIEKPSGLCTNHLACAFQECSEKGFNRQQFQTIDPDSTYNDVKHNFGSLNLPIMISFPKNAAEVVGAVRHAKKEGLKVSIKSTGHSSTGSSTVGNSLQLNLRDYNKNSVDPTSVVECTIDRSDEHRNACKLAIARGKKALIKVGGGEVWSDVYLAVMNAKTEDCYHVVGGAAGSVGAAGGWLQGGGWSHGIERMYGLGVDQVLELEMVLADERHIKFGPTEWEESDGFLYPKTTRVDGYCDQNIDTATKNTDPLWVICDDPVPPFGDLWFAVRGGGGGTYGVVTAVKYQLHESKPLEMINLNMFSFGAMFIKAGLFDNFANIHDKVTKIWAVFLRDVLYKPSNLGISEETSSKCGASNLGSNLRLSLSQPGLFFCYDNVWTNTLLPKWEERVREESEFLFHILKVNVKNLWMATKHKSFTGAAMFVTQMITGIPPISNYFDYYPEGRIPDYPTPGLLPTRSYGGWCSASFPTWWLANVENDEQRENDIFTVLSTIKSGHVTGGFMNMAHDQTTALPPFQRESGLTSVNIKTFDSALQSRLLSSFLNETITSGAPFPGMSEMNHVCIEAYGPTKDDITVMCPNYLTVEEKENKCISPREFIWGTEILDRLEDIKLNVDPDNIFDCNTCVKPKGYIDRFSQ